MKMWQILLFFLQILCGKCNTGLGHEFIGDGPKQGQNRYWIFSESLTFVPHDSKYILLNFKNLFLHPRRWFTVWKVFIDVYVRISLVTIKMTGFCFLNVIVIK